MNPEPNNFNPNRLIDTPRTLNEAYQTNAGSAVVRDDDADKEYSINHLKEEINKVVWMYAASDTTLKDADDLAGKILDLFLENRQAHGVSTVFRAVA